MSLAMGAGHSDIDTPTDDPKCWSGPAHSCSNVWVTAATGSDGLNGVWMASDWPCNKHTACRVHTTIHIRCYVHFIFLLHSLKSRVNVLSTVCTWAKALVRYQQTIGSALLDNLLFPTATLPVSPFVCDPSEKNVSKTILNLIRSGLFFYRSIWCAWVLQY